MKQVFLKENEHIKLIKMYFYHRDLVTLNSIYPYNDTVQVESKIIDYFIKNNKSYTQTDCIDLCVEEQILQECNCTNQAIGEVQNCVRKIKNFYTCFSHKQNIYMNENKHIPDACSQQCKPECKNIVYRITTNSVNDLENYPSFFFDGNQSKLNFN